MGLRLRKYSLFSGLLTLMVSSTLSPLQAATAVATVEVNIINIISIATRNGLSFGDISSGDSAGTVTLSPSGNRTTTGGATVNTATGAAPATFDLEGTPNAGYAVTLPDSVVLNDGVGNTMTVDGFTSSPAAGGVLDPSGGHILYVGATLNVGNNQSFGSYSGKMAVTVDYN
ncbi:MAG: DUF4402 domain-containing protein [Pseudomonadota bacterium]